MARTFHKAFVGMPVAMQNLAEPTFEIWCRLHFHPVEGDGTIAYLKENEKPWSAVIRALGISVRHRRRYRDAIRELLDHGFVIADPDRVRLANWPERQGWRKGRVPSPQRETRSGNVTELRVVNGSNADTPPDEVWHWDEEGPLF